MPLFTLHALLCAGMQTYYILYFLFSFLVLLVNWHSCVASIEHDDRFHVTNTRYINAIFKFAYLSDDATKSKVECCARAAALAIVATKLLSAAVAAVHIPYR